LARRRAGPGPLGARWEPRLSGKAAGGRHHTQAGQAAGEGRRHAAALGERACGRPGACDERRAAREQRRDEAGLHGSLQLRERRAQPPRALGLPDRLRTPVEGLAAPTIRATTPWRLKLCGCAVMRRGRWQAGRRAADHLCVVMQHADLQTCNAFPACFPTGVRTRRTWRQACAGQSAASASRGSAASTRSRPAAIRASRGSSAGSGGSSTPCGLAGSWPSPATSPSPTPAGGDAEPAAESCAASGGALRPGSAGGGSAAHGAARALPALASPCRPPSREAAGSEAGSAENAAACRGGVSSHSCVAASPMQPTPGALRPQHPRQHAARHWSPHSHPRRHTAMHQRPGQQALLRRVRW